MKKKDEKLELSSAGVHDHSDRIQTHDSVCT